MICGSCEGSGLIYLDSDFTEYESCDFCEGKGEIHCKPSELREEILRYFSINRLKTRKFTVNEILKHIEQSEETI